MSACSSTEPFQPSAPVLRSGSGALLLYRRLVRNLAFVSLAAGVWAADLPAALGEVKSAAQVVSVEGPGQMRPDERADWRPAVENQDLFAGNFVRTGAYARMGLLFRDRTQVRLHQQTLLQIKDVQDPARQTGTTLLRLSLGRAWSQTKTPPKELFMETPSATAAIRGTDWELEVADDGRSTLTVFSGEVDFFNDFGKVTVRKNEQALAEVGKAPLKLIIVNPRDRVQWVTAYAVEPLRHIYLYGSRLDALRRDLASAQGDRPDLRARRARILADLGDWTHAEAEFQAAHRAQPEAAGPMLGLGFVALKQGHPRQATVWFDRAADNAEAQDREVLALGRVAADIESEHLASAVGALQDLLAAPSRQPAPYLLLSDLMVQDGRLDRATEYAQMGLARFPDDARLYGQLARVYLVADLSAKSAQEARRGLARDRDSYEARIVLGDRARVEGDAQGALHAYSEAADLKPADDRAWYGRGVVQSEREYVRQARQDLGKALELNPAGPGYEGELGTLETFANRFDAADKAFQTALKAKPDDYVALTGLGLLDLKRGRTRQALDAFLRAGLLEPRYARAHVYTAVAYYQLGRVPQALEELQRAAELDAKDPLPHFLASIIYTDLFQADRAVQEARQALELLPYLKSLNEIQTNRQGTANLGQAFAFFGMEEWAKNYAQESYYPFWAGSHLFLADRYPGLFDKNSELFQGFIADPTVFGASNRFQTLFTKPGYYFTGGITGGGSNDADAYQPIAQANGLNNAALPFSYFVNYEPLRANANLGPIDQDSYTAAIGLLPTQESALFVFGNRNDVNQRLEGVFAGFQSDLRDRLGLQRGDAGAHYKLSPTSQVWLKVGRFESSDHSHGTLDGTQVDSNTDVGEPEYALRHSFALGQQHEVTWGMEYANRDTGSQFSELLFPEFNGSLLTDMQFRDESWEFYVSDRFKVTPRLLIEVGLLYQRHPRSADYATFGVIPPVQQLFSSSTERFNPGQVSPRVGLVYGFGGNRLIRLAFQNWIRPAAFSTLGPVATAGIPLEDRLVGSGGELTSYRGQLEWEWTPRTFTLAYVDYKSIHNNLFQLTPFTITDIEDLLKLRSRSFATLASDDLLEVGAGADFDAGRITSAGAAINHILSQRWSMFLRYVYTSSENTSDAFHGNRIPFLPLDAGAAGVTYVGPRGLFFITRAIYRSERFSDQANAARLKASWDSAADLFWESPQKRWLLRLGIDQAFNRNQPTFYSAEVNVRF